MVSAEANDGKTLTWRFVIGQTGSNEVKFSSDMLSRNFLDLAFSEDLLSEERFSL